jgi:hypothetical protein
MEHVTASRIRPPRIPGLADMDLEEAYTNAQKNKGGRPDIPVGAHDRFLIQLPSSPTSASPRTSRRYRGQDQAEGCGEWPPFQTPASLKGGPTPAPAGPS